MAKTKEVEPTDVPPDPYPPGTNLLASYLALGQLPASEPALVTASASVRTAPGPEIRPPIPTALPPESSDGD
jgi:hypothetical protein